MTDAGASARDNSPRGELAVCTKLRGDGEVSPGVYVVYKVLYKILAPLEMP